MMRRNSIFWGTIIVILGFMFLLNTMGILSFDIWKYFWPIVLILLGLWFLLAPVFFKQQSSQETVSIPLEETQKAHLSLQHGAGELRLSSGTTQNELAAGTFVGGVEQDLRRSNNETFLTFSAPPFAFTTWPHDHGLKWDIQLNTSPDFDLNIKTGASESHLDLSDLQISNIEFSTGASSTTIYLPAHTAHTKARVDSGAASVKIYVPENVAARIHFEGGLIETKVDQSRFPRVGEFYVSPNFEESAQKAEIFFSGGVGSISVL